MWFQPFKIPHVSETVMYMWHILLGTISSNCFILNKTDFFPFKDRYDFIIYNSSLLLDSGQLHLLSLFNIPAVIMELDIFLTY